MGTQGMRMVNVLVKHTDGSRTRYSVLTRNILRKHVTKTHKSPEQLRAEAIERGDIKPAV